MNPRNVDLEKVLVKVYELRDPRDSECKPRYIGITTFSLKKRLAEHTQKSEIIKNTHKNNWIKSLLKNGVKPTIHLIEEVESWKYACKCERYWIKEFNKQGYNLTNTSEGGEGHLGMKVSEKFKKYLSEINTGTKHPQYIKDLDRIGIVQDYIKGLSTPKLSKKYNIGITKIFKLLKENNIKSRNPIDYNSKVIQYGLDGYFIKEWNSVSEVIKAFNSCSSGISRACIHKGLMKGYQWRYYTENYPNKIDCAKRIVLNKYVKYEVNLATKEKILIT
jgi:hypothetical protein